ncbi:hypothetical protein CRG98_038125 [Punica granatum]|uniref:Uncharacterized protein n=1 Tax=Punica granatum TaxID=22663 RepID=A0A2I0IBV7_PUNGR|nr:hypothetical protein CRG98_038125 [Punica granatum]
MEIRRSFEPRTSNPRSIETRTFPQGYRVDPRLFLENDHHSHLRRSIRVDPITLGANNHHGHLEGSLGYPESLTLPQNSIGSLRGDVRPYLCQSGNSGRNTKAPFRPLSDRSTKSLAFTGFSHNPERSKELVNTGYRPRWPVLRCFPFLKVHFQVKGNNIILSFGDTSGVSSMETRRYWNRNGLPIQAQVHLHSLSYSH